ncbi:hypothetical protein EJ02DRAFT_86740 [Clathrospora elynae]|uniref:Uncharacterized protein n=1 Tax=Clathrospora elynae TaxID=706981 RepID=A0A6A5SGD9_9PLEO|nr:hypothetical protein EJ02DRAFT_86740 [Clathrospora elynae]
MQHRRLQYVCYMQHRHLQHVCYMQHGRLQYVCYMRHVCCLGYYARGPSIYRALVPIVNTTTHFPMFDT